MDEMRLGNHIKKLREARGLTQLQLAEEIEVSRKTINTIENEVFIPSTILAFKLARALDTTVEELFWIEEKKSSKDITDLEKLPTLKPLLK